MNVNVKTLTIWPQVLHAIRARKSPQFSVDRTLTHMAVGALLLPSAGPLWEDEMFTREGQLPLPDCVLIA